jgi:hypothetical protein
MSELLQRAQTVRTLASDPSLPKWQRLRQGLQDLSGLDLDEIPDDVHAQFEADLVDVNRVLAEHSLEKDEDYQTIRDADLQQMLDIVARAASRIITAELDRIVADLDAGVRKLPVQAIREAREHRDLMVARLIKVLRDATSAARADNTPKGNAHFFAIFLLTEFQAQEAFPVILEAFSLPDELPFELFSGAVTSTLSRILALFAGERPEVMDALIGDRTLNIYVRWEAAQSYVHLVRDGRLERDEAIERLQQHLRTAIDREDEEIGSSLVSVLVSFAPEEALEDITEAYDRGLIDTDIVAIEDVERSIAEGEPRIRKELEWCAETGIEDTIEELQRWAAFQEKPAKRRTSPPFAPHFAASEEPVESQTTAVLSHGRRTGRNDPCPCGSGKKYKKCCGARK